MRFWEFLREKWDAYQTQKKSDELYNKLHRFDNAKFSHKEALANARAAYKKKREQKRSMQEEVRKHEGR